MRHVVLVGLLLLLSGCGKTEPTMLHGHPVTYWLAALQDPDPKTRKTAVKQLGNVGAIDPAVIPAFVSAVKDRDPGVRAEAVLALLHIGPDAKDAIPALEEATNDRDAKVREYAAKALERIQSRK